MAVESLLRDADAPPVYYVKGAIEPILERSTTVMESENVTVPMTQQWRDELCGFEQSMSLEGLRVLSFATGNSLQTLSFVGFIGMYDPPRPEAAFTVREMIRSNIQVIMITGDSCELAY